MKRTVVKRVITATPTADPIRMTLLSSCLDSFVGAENKVIWDGKLTCFSAKSIEAANAFNASK